MEYDKGIDSEEESIIIKTIFWTFQHNIFRANSNFFTAYLILYQLTKKNLLRMFSFFSGAGEWVIVMVRGKDVRSKKKRLILDNHNEKGTLAHRRKRNVGSITEGTPSPLVFRKVKIKERRNVFRLAKFCCCKLTIKVVLVLMLLLWATMDYSTRITLVVSYF